jgi:hypothetical protein
MISAKDQEFETLLRLASIYQKTVQENASQHLPSGLEREPNDATENGAQGPWRSKRV